MYGFVLEGVNSYLLDMHGAETLQQVLERAGINFTSFSPHQIYSEKTVAKLAQAACELTQQGEAQLMEKLGTYFLTYIERYGYEQILSSLGRDLSAFMNSLDDLHETIRLSYPKLKPPSFNVLHEDANGLSLRYRSKREGHFIYYVIGQIREVSRRFYSTEVDIKVESMMKVGSQIDAVLVLKFDNKKFAQENEKIYEPDSVYNKEFPAKIFFELYPFHIVFNKDLKILCVGKSIAAILSDVIDQPLVNAFDLAHPMIEYTWDDIGRHLNNQFEFRSTRELPNRSVFVTEDDEEAAVATSQEGKEGILDSNDEALCLVLKGPVLFVESWNCMVFLGTPVVENIEKLSALGLFLNDLAMHGSSRDLVIAGAQQSAEMKLIVAQEQKKNEKLDEETKKLEGLVGAMEQSLYMYVPPSVAERLQKGEPPRSFCQKHPDASVLFATFGDMSTVGNPTEIIAVLNTAYAVFDRLCFKHYATKIETCRDPYMVLCGIPDETEFHACHLVDLGLSMIGATSIINTDAGKPFLKLKLGVNSGSITSAIIGLKMPRYVVVGRTVDRASELLQYGGPSELTISDAAMERISDYSYAVSKKNEVVLKDGCTMSVHTVTGGADGVPYPDAEKLRPPSPEWHKYISYTPVMNDIPAGIQF